MIDKIIKIVTSSSEVNSNDDATLLCKYTVDDISVIDDLVNGDVLENTFTNEIKIGDVIELEISLLGARRFGFYYSKEIFLKWNAYEKVTNKTYIHEIEAYNDNPIFNFHQKIVELKNQLVQNAKHSYIEDDTLNIILLREDKSLFMPIIYSIEDLDSIDEQVAEKLDYLAQILEDKNFSDKKNMFISTIIDELSEKDEEERFSNLIKSLNLIYDKALASYNFYLRNFSYNKLKLELDSKSTEFNQKLQSVINDSQNKLIAIPTALVFVLATLDYEKISGTKNFMIVIGIIIFAVLIQIFINNQKSALSFIEGNISHYKNTFKDSSETFITEAFFKVDQERVKQKNRIYLIQSLLWFVPVLTICTILYFSLMKVISLVIALVYIISTVAYFYYKKSEV